MSLININFDGLTQETGSLGSRISTYEALSSRLTEMIARTKSTWTGQAADAWNEKMTQYQSQVNKMIEILKAFQSYTGSVNTNFQQLDAQCGNRIRNSF